MNIHKIPIYGQYALEIDGTECRVVVCPDVPLDPDDLFLARTYTRACKSTTPKNMYSRWLNATGSLVKNKRLELVNEPCRVYTFSIISAQTEFHNCAVAQTARTVNLVKTALEDLDVVLDFHCGTIIADYDVEPVNLLFQVIVPAQSDLSFDWFNRDSIVDIINQL